MNVNEILSSIDQGFILLPVFQRGYVWNRNQVRHLMDSLYHKYPVGSLLMWQAHSEGVDNRGNVPAAASPVKLILDGQQRITTLYGIIKGKQPPFFEGNAGIFTGLYFNVETQAFEFYAPSRMSNNPLWVNVTDLMQKGIGPTMALFFQNEDLQPHLETYLNRLNAVAAIGETYLHEDTVSGTDKTVDVVVDIFNRINSGGTKLSQADLALAKICTVWPEARDELKLRLSKWSRAGFQFKLEWLLRCLNALVTGEARFSAIADKSADEIETGLSKTERHVDYLLNLISSQLGLDHTRVLAGPYAFPVMVRYLEQGGGHLADYKEANKLLFWYIHTFLWGRYSGSTESALGQDLAAIREGDAGLDNLIENLRIIRGHLHISPDDFSASTIGARFYPMLYMLTRVNHARDWGTGIELSNATLGKGTSLEMHHIFPKSRLYKCGYSRNEVNALANFTFLTKETNLKVSNRHPAEYIPEYVPKHPGAVASHWMPLNDDTIWQLDKYQDFLKARRELLAEAANEFLNNLLESAISSPVPVDAALLDIERLPGGVVSDEEQQQLEDVNRQLVAMGLSEGELRYELIDELTEQPVAMIDLAWPDGLQVGLSQPVALLIDEDAAVETLVSQAGFRIYTDADSLMHYVSQDVLALDVAAD